MVSKLYRHHFPTVHQFLLNSNKETCLVQVHAASSKHDHRRYPIFPRRPSSTRQLFNASSVKLSIKVTPLSTPKAIPKCPDQVNQASRLYPPQQIWHGFWARQPRLSSRISRTVLRRLLCPR